MSWYVDGRGRRGHVSTREYRNPRDIEPKRYHPADDDYPVSVWRKSYANAITDLRLAREGADYPVYPDHVKRAFDAALASARWGWPEGNAIAQAAAIMAQSAPRMRMGEPVATIA